MPQRGRLSILAAAYVIARRDFVAILWSRSFIFFLLGPLFPVFVGAMAGSIGSHVEQTVDAPQIGLMMQGADVDAMLSSQAALARDLGDDVPDLVVIRRLKAGEAGDPHAALGDRRINGGNLSAIISGTPAAPVLTGTREQIAGQRGSVALIAARASGHGPDAVPKVTLSATATSTAVQNRSRIITAQAAQTLLFLLTMLLAGMVLSNLVEEKGNKIIEILAAAIPMDAVFLGKLFAMLAVSLVGIAVWAVAGGVIHLVGGRALPSLIAPAVGWPLFFTLGVAYFSMAYLILGAIFLAIGSLASTVREIQTLNMPVTMMQLMVFFFASYAMARQGTMVEAAAILVPFSSPFAMLARAAIHPEIWPHLAALAWQALWVAIFIRGGAALFRKRVMQSGPAPRSGKRRGLFAALLHARE
jgi:ABC-2 type transport system permease protein